MSIRTPRENDELILDMVKLRAAGSTLLRIAEKHLVSPNRPRHCAQRPSRNCTLLGAKEMMPTGPKAAPVSGADISMWNNADGRWQSQDAGDPRHI